MDNNPAVVAQWSKALSQIQIERMPLEDAYVGNIQNKK